MNWYQRNLSPTGHWFFDLYLYMLVFAIVAGAYVWIVTPQAPQATVTCNLYTDICILDPTVEDFERLYAE